LPNIFFCNPCKTYRLRTQVATCFQYICSNNHDGQQVTCQTRLVMLGLFETTCSLICHGTSFRRQRSDLFRLGDKLPPIVTCL